MSGQGDGAEAFDDKSSTSLVDEEAGMSSDTLRHSDDDTLEEMFNSGSTADLWRARIYNKRKPILASLGILVFVTLVLVAAALTTGLAVGLTSGNRKYTPVAEDYVLTPDEGDPFTRDKAGKEMIVTTREYQLKLYKDRFKNREKGIADMLEYLEPYLGVPLQHDGNVTLWRERHYKTKHCGKEYSELRSRDVLFSTFPPFVDTTIYNLKQNTGKNVGKASELLYLPSDEYADGTVQKVEMDVHACSHKYSRKSMVVSNVEFNSTIDTCQQLHEVYPHAFKTPENATATVKVKDVSYWWVYSVEGFLPAADGWEQTHFKIAFTLVYYDEESARTGEVLPHGETEWSIRLWSSEDGHGNWDESVLENMADTYVALLEEFGTNEHSYPCK